MSLQPTNPFAENIPLAPAGWHSVATLEPRQSTVRQVLVVRISDQMVEAVRYLGFVALEGRGMADTWVTPTGAHYRRSDLAGWRELPR